MFAALGLGLALATGGVQGAEAPTQRIDPWFGEGFHFLKDHHFLIGYPDGLAKRTGPPSRYEFAVIYNAAAFHLESLAGALSDDAEKLASETDTKESERQLAEFRERYDTLKGRDTVRAIDYVLRADGEFNSELKELGLSDHEIRIKMGQTRRELAHVSIPKIGSALKQFSDVPAGHWAAKSTLELRSSGILHGLPDGTFRG